MVAGPSRNWFCQSLAPDFVSTYFALGSEGLWVVWKGLGGYWKIRQGQGGSRRIREGPEVINANFIAIHFLNSHYFCIFASVKKF